MSALGQENINCNELLPFLDNFKSKREENAVRSLSRRAREVVQTLNALRSSFHLRQPENHKSDGVKSRTSIIPAHAEDELEMTLYTILSEMIQELKQLEEISMMGYLLHRQEIRASLSGLNSRLRAVKHAAEISKWWGNSHQNTLEQINITTHQPPNNEGLVDLSNGQALRISQQLARAPSVIRERPHFHPPPGSLEDLSSFSHSNLTAPPREDSSDGAQSKDEDAGTLDVEAAVSHVITLSEDPAFLLALRTDETCNFFELLDILEILSEACPAEESQKKSLFGLQVQSYYPPEPQPDRLKPEDLEERAQKIIQVSAPNSPMPTLPSLQTHDTKRSQNGASVTADNLARLRVDEKGQTRPVLVQLDAVTRIMEQNFNPRYRKSSRNCGSTTDDQKNIKRLQERTTLPRSGANDQAPGEDPQSASFKHRSRSLPVSAEELDFNSTTKDEALQCVKTTSPQEYQKSVCEAISEPSWLGKPEFSSIKRKYPSSSRASFRYATSAGEPLSLPFAPNRYIVEETCHVCGLATNHDYLKYIQLAVLYHENNELERSYHHLTHATHAAEQGNEQVPTPYFLSGLYLRHGWGTEPDLPKSFDCLLLALEFALHQAIAAGMYASDIPQDMERPPTPPAPEGVASSNKRTAVEEYIATYRDTPLPETPGDIVAGPQRMAVGLILYEISVSLKFGWGVRAHVKLGKAIARIAANLGDVYAAFEVGLKIASSARRLSFRIPAHIRAANSPSTSPKTSPYKRNTSAFEGAQLGKPRAASVPDLAPKSNVMSLENLSEDFLGSYSPPAEPKASPSSGHAWSALQRQISSANSLIPSLNMVTPKAVFDGKAMCKRAARVYLRYAIRNGVRDPSIGWVLSTKHDD